MSGVKHDANKPALELIPSAELLEMGKVMAYGATKYGKHNWTKGLEISRLIGAGLRHLNQFNAGEDLDNETNANHLAHAASNCLMALWMLKNRPDLDDRLSRQVADPGDVFPHSFKPPSKDSPLFCVSCEYWIFRCACPKPPKSGAQ